MNPSNNVPSGPSLARVLLLGVIVAALAAWAGLETIAQNAQRLNPALAMRLAPWDGGARATAAGAAYRAQLALSPGEFTAPAEDVQALALDGYVRQPLSPSALAVLSAARLDDERDALFDAAAGVSRRDRLLQSVLLQRHMNQADAERLIRVLNQILLVREDQWGAIFPILAQALRDPQSTGMFVEILRRGPTWTNEFLAFAARDRDVRGNLATVRAALPNDIISPETDKALVMALAAGDDIDLAYQLYQRLKASGEHEAGWPSSVPPFDWLLVSKAGMRAQTGGASERLSLAIDRGQGGVFATRVFPVRGRTMTIGGRYELQGPGQEDELRITAHCVASGDELGAADFRSGTIDLRLDDVPQSCRFVLVTLSGRAWSDGNRIRGTISPLTIS